VNNISKKKIAVFGYAVAGVGAPYFLASNDAVLFFEKINR